VTSRLPGGSFEKVPTATLPREARVFVLTPPSWPRQAGRRYPVLFFLHEIYGSGGSLASHGVAAELSARMQDGRLPEFFVVAPSAPASWFSDSHDGRYRYEEFLTEDLIAWVERRYPVIPASRARGMTGISMGGYGAMKIALKHPDLYGSVSALSGGLIPFDWSEDLPRYSWIARWSLKRVFGKRRDDNSLAQNDVWSLLRAAQFAQSPFRAHLMAGREDDYRLDQVAIQFGSNLNEHGVAATVAIEPGRHDWAYWRRGLIEIAEWHGKQFAYD
jgi:S-formylglutathione hydrolase FrmB